MGETAKGRFPVLTVAGIGALIAAVVSTWLLAGGPTPIDRADSPGPAPPVAPRFASTGEAREPDAVPTDSPSPTASPTASSSPGSTGGSTGGSTSGSTGGSAGGSTGGGSAGGGTNGGSTVGGGSTTPAGPTPVSRVYRLGPNVATPQLKDGTCVYRVIYGNYGSAAVAHIQFYAGGCGATTIVVAAQRGDARSYENTNSPGNLAGGSDSCGTYFVRQALSRTNQPAYAVGLRVRFAETGNTYTFLYNQGSSPPAYRTC